MFDVLDVLDGLAEGAKRSLQIVWWHRAHDIRVQDQNKVLVFRRANVIQDLYLRSEGVLNPRLEDLPDHDTAVLVDIIVAKCTAMRYSLSLRQCAMKRISSLVNLQF